MYVIPIEWDVGYVARHVCLSHERVCKSTLTIHHVCEGIFSETVIQAVQYIIMKLGEQQHILIIVVTQKPYPSILNDQNTPRVPMTTSMCSNIIQYSNNNVLVIASTHTRDGFGHPCLSG